MSEKVYTLCDGAGCKELADNVSIGGWTKDDLDADFCPKCSKAKADLEASTATAEDVEKLGEKLNEITTPLLDEKLKVEQAEFDKALEATIKKVSKDLKKQGKEPAFIADVVQQIREGAQVVWAKRS